ncbi:lyase family protein [Actinoplanes sp. G11-F43]|uniref:lyase family protein n=1 Tax=Actinoplanes sp. G11-F43 TaxID=3424130 RepID=UPI003D34C393
MAAVFSQERTVRDWLLVEAELGRALADGGVIDEATGERIAGACRLDVVDLERLWAESANVGYPIFPLVKQICEALDDRDAAWVHYGATTQDIMDTALALQLRDAADRLLVLLGEVGDGLARLVAEHAGTVMAGRTHAQQAVPTTFGAKLAVFLGEATRHRDRLLRARAAVAVVSLFGAGGTSAALGDVAGRVRTGLAARTGLADTLAPWHVSRDTIAELTQAAALAAATCVRLGREIVDLSRTEIGEVAEADGMYRGASSTMPQKANPISSELAVGFGVMATSHAQAVLRAMEVGHERAAGEWQVEWQAVPGALVAAAGALRAAAAITGGLRVFPDRMAVNLTADGGRLMAEAYMIALAAELGRDKAHELVYGAVRDSRATGSTLRDAVRARVGDGAWSAIAETLPEPAGYVGSTREICDAAVLRWRDAKH